LALILLVTSDTRAETALARALDPPYQVRVAASLSEVEQRLAGGEIRACIVDVFHALSPFPAGTLQKIRKQHPAVALIAASEFSGREIELYRLGRMNVDGVIRLETNPSPRDIHTLVEGALGSRLAAYVVASVAFDLSPLPRDAIRWCIEHAEAKPQVSRLAGALGVSRKTLLKELKAVGVRPPRDLLLWGRLIRACDLLERGDETVESVAYHLGYSTGGALRRALRKKVGHSPTALLQRGGLDLTLDAFRRRGLRSPYRGMEK